MKLKILFIYFFLLQIIPCIAQEANKPIRIVDNELGFSMDLPKGFAKLSDKEVGVALEKGKKQIDKIYNSDVSINGLEPNLFKKDDNNFFIINIKDFPATEKEYQEEVKAYNALIYNTYRKSFPKAEITEFSETKKIGGIVFKKYSLKAVISKSVVMKVIGYNTLYKGKDVTIGAVYLDDALEQEIVKAIENSRFESENKK